MAAKKASTKALGIIGLGIIGSRVADVARAAGLEVVVWNRTKKKVAGAVDSPAAVAAAARVVQVFVADDAALERVISDMAPALRAGHVVVNCSTVSLAATRAAEKAVAATGADFLDAPFTGSRNAAAAGQLVYYVGGSAAVLKRVRWALNTSAKAILPVGDVGHATILKIATNMISATTVEILSEAMGVVMAHGVALERFAAAMDLNACGSGLTKMKIPSIIQRDFAAHFSLKNMLKDARFAMALAEEGGLEVPALAVAAQRMAALVGRGKGESDYSVLATNYLPA